MLLLLNPSSAPPIVYYGAMTARKTPQTIDMLLKMHFQGDMGINPVWDFNLWRIENAACVAILGTLTAPVNVGSGAVYRIHPGGSTKLIGVFKGRPGQIAIKDQYEWQFLVPWPGFRWIDLSQNSGNPTLMYCQTVAAETANNAKPNGDPGQNKSWTIA